MTTVRPPKSAQETSVALHLCILNLRPFPNESPVVAVAIKTQPPPMFLSKQAKMQKRRHMLTVGLTSIPLDGEHQKQDPSNPPHTSSPTGVSETTATTTQMSSTFPPL
jgi:hypothetical protein